jgi:hypothetical protein
VLTDHNYDIMNLLRTHRYDEQTLVAVRQRYPLQLARQHTRVTPEVIAAVLKAADPKDTLRSSLGAKLGECMTTPQWGRDDCLCGEAEYGMQLFEHCLAEAGIDVATRVSTLSIGPGMLAVQSSTCEWSDVCAPGSDTVARLYAALQHADDVVERLLPVSGPGFLVLKPGAVPAPAVAAPAQGKGGKQGDTEPAAAAAAAAAEGTVPVPAVAEVAAAAAAAAPAPADEEGDGTQAPKYVRSLLVGGRDTDLGRNTLYDDVVPFFVPAAHRGAETVRMATFDEALDEFFSKMEATKAERAKATHENAAMKKVEFMRADQLRRVEALETAQLEAETRARLIEAHSQEVDAVILVLRAAVAQAVDWAELARVIKDRKRQVAPLPCAAVCSGSPPSGGTGRPAVQHDPQPQAGRQQGHAAAVAHRRRRGVADPARHAGTGSCLFDLTAG